MDTSKLVLEVDSDKFHDTYVHFLRKLYDDQFIKKHHFTVDDSMSFRRTFAKKAGVEDITKRTEHSVFTKEEMDAIVEDTNNKYEECATGKYTKSVAERQMRRYRVVSRVLKETLTELGFKEAADKLLYTNDLEESDTLPSAPSQEAQDKKAEILEKAKRTQEIIELNKYITILKTSVANLDTKVSAVEAVEIMSKEDKEKYLQLQEELQRSIESAEKCVQNKDYPEAEELKTFIKTATDILERLEKLQDKPENIVAESAPDIQEETVTPVETDHKLSLNNSVAALIPLMTEELKKFLRHCAEKISEDEITINNLTERIKELEEAINILNNKPTLPEDEEELFALAEKIIEKISDKDKIKKLVFLGMTKM